MAKASTLALGVDIGGTKVASGLVDSSGKILHSARTRMITNKTAADGLHGVFAAIDSVLHETRKRPGAIGVCAPGWVDSAKGVLLSAANIPCWRDFPLAGEIRKRYKLPTRLANDANAAALAEAAWGAGAGYRNVFYVTLGTGIGTAFVQQQRIYLGRTGAAGEGGHVSINFRGPRCACGKQGCIEVYASGTAIARRARERLTEENSSQSRLAKSGPAITAEAVAKAAESGDRLAIEVLDEAADSFAIWLGGIIDLLEPDVIVVGGGMARLMISMLGRVRSQLKKWAVNPRQQQIPIVNAFYGSESALVGAAALGLPRLKQFISRAS
jgi:glucokinase